MHWALRQSGDRRLLVMPVSAVGWWDEDLSGIGLIPKTRPFRSVLVVRPFPGSGLLQGSGSRFVWRMSRRSRGALPALAGRRFRPDFRSGRGRASPGGDGNNGGAKWHVHWYVYPLLYWMEILTDMGCMEQSSFDIAYVTEIDPLWQDDTLTALINPEVAIFANPIAQVACAADCAAATTKLPLDPLFWCAGCLGPMYPMNGNIGAHVGEIQSSRLALSRFAYKLHRQAIAWGTMGSKGLCGKYVMPIMRKQQYRFQATIPSPMVKGRWACPPIGASDMKPGSGNAIRDWRGLRIFGSGANAIAAFCSGGRAMRRGLIIAVAGVALVGASYALAQNVEGLDIQAVLGLGESGEKDAQALADEVLRRSKDMQDEARSVAEQGQANMQRNAGRVGGGPAGPIDFDELVRTASANQTEGGRAPQLMVFASLSMPPDRVETVDP